MSEQWAVLRKYSDGHRVIELFDGKCSADLIAEQLNRLTGSDRYVAEARPNHLPLAG